MKFRGPQSNNVNNCTTLFNYPIFSLVWKQLTSTTNAFHRLQKRPAFFISSIRLWKSTGNVFTFLNRFDIGILVTGFT